MTNDLQRKR